MPARSPPLQEQASHQEREPRDVGHDLVAELPIPRVQPKGRGRERREPPAHALPQELVEEQHADHAKQADVEVEGPEFAIEERHDRQQQHRQARRPQYERNSQVAVPVSVSQGSGSADVDGRIAHLFEPRVDQEREARQQSDPEEGGREDHQACAEARRKAPQGSTT